MNKRTPIRELGQLWDKAQVADARKRVAAKRYIIRNSKVGMDELAATPTSMLVLLCQCVRDLQRGRPAPLPTLLENPSARGGDPSPASADT